LCDPSQAATECPGEIVIQRQQREQLAKSPGGHARAVDRFDVTCVNAIELESERVESLSEWSVQMRRIAHEPADCNRRVTAARLIRAANHVKRR
jgi:hypothetical protein